MIGPAHGTVASRFAHDSPPYNWGPARALPATVKSGRAMSLRNGVTHMVREAVIATGPEGAVLAARWQCGSNSSNAVPLAVDDEPGVVCANCVAAGQMPVGPTVYRCFDDEDDLIYVGSTINAARRIRQHRSSTYWWEDVERVTFDTYDTEAHARRAEAEAIASEEPFYNIAGRSIAAP